MEHTSSRATKAIGDVAGPVVERVEVAGAQRGGHVGPAQI
jgi:hypothetical protein